MSVGLVPIASSLAVFQGVKLFAEAVSKYGDDQLAARAAGRDSRKYESYFKTCKHFTDFVAGFGVQALSIKCCNTKKHHSVDNDKGTAICDKQRIIGTPQMQKDFISNMLREKIWEKTTHKICGKQAFYCKSNNLWYTKVVREKNDIEVWKVSGKRAKHIGAIECKYWTMYEGHKHPDAEFE